MYYATLPQKRRSRILNHKEFVTVSLSAIVKERAMHAYIDLLSDLNIPLSCIENRVMCQHVVHKPAISVKCFKEVLFALTQFMENATGREISDTKGEIVHGAWKHFDTHYFGIFASYMNKMSFERSGISQTIEEHALPLLSVSPMLNVREDNGGDGDGSTVLDSATHERRIEQVFQFFKMDVHD